MEFVVRAIDQENGIDAEMIIELNGWAQDAGTRWGDKRPFLGKKLRTLKGAAFFWYLDFLTFSFQTPVMFATSAAAAKPPHSTTQRRALIADLIER